jgi:hypothetical protein
MSVAASSAARSFAGKIMEKKKRKDETTGVGRRATWSFYSFPQLKLICLVLVVCCEPKYKFIVC